MHSMTETLHKTNVLSWMYPPTCLAGNCCCSSVLTQSWADAATMLAIHPICVCVFFFFFTSPGQRVSRVHFRSFVRFATRQKDVILKVRHKGQLVLPDMISF